MEADDRAVITEATLKVMTEEDYLAMQKNNFVGVGSKPTRNNGQVTNLPLQGSNTTAMRDIIIPLIEKEVNTGKDFAQLRQLYRSIIMAEWFKKKLKSTILNQVYFNKEKIKGADCNDPKIKDKIYNEYVNAFKTGVYNMIKTERVGMKISKRQYFSGGVARFAEDGQAAANDPVSATRERVNRAGVLGVKDPATGQPNGTEATVVLDLQENDGALQTTQVPAAKPAISMSKRAREITSVWHSAIISPDSFSDEFLVQAGIKYPGVFRNNLAMAAEMFPDWLPSEICKAIVLGHDLPGKIKDEAVKREARKDFIEERRFTQKDFDGTPEQRMAKLGPIGRIAFNAPAKIKNPLFVRGYSSDDIKDAIIAIGYWTGMVGLMGVDITRATADKPSFALSDVTDALKNSDYERAMSLGLMLDGAGERNEALLTIATKATSVDDLLTHDPSRRVYLLDVADRAMQSARPEAVKAAIKQKIDAANDMVISTEFKVRLAALPLFTETDIANALRMGDYERAMDMALELQDEGEKDKTLLAIARQAISSKSLLSGNQSRRAYLFEVAGRAMDKAKNAKLEVRKEIDAANKMASSSAFQARLAESLRAGDTAANFKSGQLQHTIDTAWSHTKSEAIVDADLKAAGVKDFDGFRKALRLAQVIYPKLLSPEVSRAIVAGHRKKGRIKQSAIEREGGKPVYRRRFTQDDFEPALNLSQQKLSPSRRNGVRDFQRASKLLPIMVAAKKLAPQLAVEYDVGEEDARSAIIAIGYWAGLIGLMGVDDGKLKTTGGLDFASVDNIQITAPDGGTKLSGKKAVDYLVNGKVTGAKLITTAIRF
jgi:hypothetical protein